ncbi:MAG: hypothetical protein QF745_08635, partial [Planctomycetota bacterium]|nr:hypothetical protein [Planctomycetota bacterium]
MRLQKLDSTIEESPLESKRRYHGFGAWRDRVRERTCRLLKGEGRNREGERIVNKSSGRFSRFRRG